MDNRLALVAEQAERGTRHVRLQPAEAKPDSLWNICSFGYRNCNLTRAIHDRWHEACELSALPWCETCGDHHKGGHE